MRGSTTRAGAVLLLALGVGLGLGLARLGSDAAADGDPLEEYDYSGRVPIERFVMQARHRVWQHGLWTVQRHRLLDPFRGTQWSLFGCTFDQINVYYGTRPMWSSGTMYQVSVGEGDFGQRDLPRWELVADTIDEDYGRDIPLVDRTGGEDLTLQIHFWNGGASAGASDKLIRLSGSSPATAKVEVLWAGDYADWKDLDGDGVPELIDSDDAHWHAAYLPWKGFQATVVRVFDPASARYALASAHRILGTTGGAGLEAHLRGRKEGVRTAMRAMRAGADDPHTAHLVAVVGLAEVLFDLLRVGRLGEAVTFFHEVVPPDADLAEPGSTERLGPEAWWAAFVEASKRSEHWKALQARHPELLRLGG